MGKKLLQGFVLVIALALTGFTQQNIGPTVPGQSAAFRQGQPVYIAAFRQAIHHERRGTEHTALVAQELDLEKRVRKEFEAIGVFKVVDKISEAEFVFLVYVDSSTAEGLVLVPEKYRQLKEKFDLDMLREAAYGRHIVGPFKLPTSGKISDRLVKKFHEGSGMRTKGKG